MKKVHLFSTAVLATALLMSGCGDKKAEQKKAEAPKNTTKMVAVAEASAPVDYEKAYAPIIEEAIACVPKITNDGSVPDEFMGISEYARYNGTDKAYNNIGYSIKDISGDDVPELIIGNSDEGANNETMIYTLYSLENNKPKKLASGYYRSVYYLLKNNKIFHRGSGGAAISIRSIYTLDFNGQKLNCDSYYFTDMNIHDPGKIEFFKNSFGKFDKSISQKISESEFTQASESLNKQIATIPLTSFAQYRAAHQVQGNPDVHFAIKHAQEVVGDVSDFVRYDAYHGQGSVEIAIVFNHPLKSFKLLKLDYVDKGDGKMHFNTKTVYTTAVLEMPFVSRVSIPGTIPAYGISFTDIKGKYHQYAITESGEDGRLMLVKF